MSYQSPVSLLTAEQRTSFEPHDLKKIKNALLLHFQLSAEPLIEIEHQMYNKDEVLALLDAFQKDPELHLAIHRNSALLEFLEKGELDYFLNDASINAILNEPQHADKIHALIVEEINEQLPKIILEFTPKTVFRLLKIRAFTSTISPALESKAYQEAFGVFKNFVDQLKDRFPVPYLSESNFTFHPELKKILNRKVLSMFQYLPPEFQYCHQKLATWCNNCVVMPYTSKEHLIRSWPKDSLRQVIEAAHIAASTFNKEGNLKIAAMLEGHLKDNPQGAGARFVFLILILIFGIIRMGGTCNRTTNHYPQRNLNQYAYRVDNEKVKEMLETQQIVLEDNITIIEEPSVPGISLAPFNGGFRPVDGMYKYKGANWDAKQQKLTVSYDTEIIPTTAVKLKEFIPPSVVEKYKGQEVPVVLKFTKTGISEGTFAHALTLAANSVVTDRHIGPSENRKSAVFVKPIPADAFHFKGFITLLDPESAVLDRDTIRIRGVDSTGAPQWEYNGTPFLYVRNESDSIAFARDLRLRCIAQNMQRADRISLHRANANKLTNLHTYGFSLNTDTDRKLLDHRDVGLFLVRESLFYLFTSMEDGTAYFALAGPGYDVKYMFDSKTGYLKAIQMATRGKDSKAIERIELFRVAN